MFWTGLQPWLPTYVGVVSSMQILSYSNSIYRSSILVLLVAMIPLRPYQAALDYQVFYCLLPLIYCPMGS